MAKYKCTEINWTGTILSQSDHDVMVMLLCVVLPLLAASGTSASASPVVAVMVEIWWNIREDLPTVSAVLFLPLLEYPGHGDGEVVVVFGDLTHDSITHIDEVGERDWRVEINSRVGPGDDLPLVGQVVHLDGVAVLGHNSPIDKSWFSMRLRSTWVG